MWLRMAPVTQSQFTHEHFQFSSTQTAAAAAPARTPCPGLPHLCAVLHFTEIPRKIHGIKGLFFLHFAFFISFEVYPLAPSFYLPFSLALFRVSHFFFSPRFCLFSLMCHTHFISNCCWRPWRWRWRWRLAKLTPSTPMAQLL